MLRLVEVTKPTRDLEVRIRAVASPSRRRRGRRRGRGRGRARPSFDRAPPRSLALSRAPISQPRGARGVVASRPAVVTTRRDTRVVRRAWWVGGVVVGGMVGGPAKATLLGAKAPGDDRRLVLQVR